MYDEAEKKHDGRSAAGGNREGGTGVKGQGERARKLGRQAQQRERGETDEEDPFFLLSLEPSEIYS